MNVIISWDGEERSVLRYTFSGAWDWDELYAAFEVQQVDCLLDQLCVIIDLRQTTHIPSDAVLHLQRAASMAKEVNGKIVIIATNTAAVTMFRLFVSIYRSVSAKFWLASNDEEAAELLRD